MRCDLHVHTIHSGMCTVPVFDRICRESYNEPLAVYEILKRRGMDLVTITDHDSIGAAEELRKFPDFFLSEEVSCTTPDGTQLHVGVYDITERDHTELQRRRDDLLSLIGYMRERRLLFSLNHVFSRLTGRRTAADFELFERHFPAVETRNGQMPARGNGAAARLAAGWEKAVVAGSDSHTLGSLGLTYTAAPGARSKVEYLERVRLRAGVAEGESGRYGKLTRAVAEIAMELFREKRWTMALSPLLVALPVVTLVNCLLEDAFARWWEKRVMPESARGSGWKTAQRCMESAGSN